MSILIATPNPQDESWFEAFRRRSKQVNIQPSDIEFWPNVKNADDIEYLVTWKPPYKICDKLPKLKAIFNLGAGVDHLLLDDSLPKNVPIIRVVDDNLTQRMGEYVCLHTLYHQRNMVELNNLQTKHQWVEQYDPIASAVSVGVMGLGQIGAYCADLLVKIGFKTLGWSNSKKDINGVEAYTGAAELDEFLANTEILVNILPHTRQTDRLINYSLLKKLKKDGSLGGSSYITAGRGKTHVEHDILKALEDGCLKSASMDVFEQEPLAEDSPLWSLNNLLITPHNAASSDRETVSLQILKQIASHKLGGKLNNIVDLQRGY